MSVGVYFDCTAADEKRVWVLRARAWRALLRGPALLLSVVPVKVMRGSLYHRLSAVSDAIEWEGALREMGAGCYICCMLVFSSLASLALSGFWFQLDNLLGEVCHTPSLGPRCSVRRPIKVSVALTMGTSDQLCVWYCEFDLQLPRPLHSFFLYDDSLLSEPWRGRLPTSEADKTKSSYPVITWHTLWTALVQHYDAEKRIRCHVFWAQETSIIPMHYAQVKRRRLPVRMNNHDVAQRYEVNQFWLVLMLTNPAGWRIPGLHDSHQLWPVYERLSCESGRAGIMNSAGGPLVKWWLSVS